MNTRWTIYAIAVVVAACHFMPAKYPCRPEDAEAIKRQCVAAAQACDPEPARCIELEVCLARTEQRTVECLAR